MKIAVCDIQPPSFAVGGQQIEILNYAETFIEIGHDVDIYFNDTVGPRLPELLAKTRIEEIHLMSTLDWGYDLYFSGYTFLKFKQDYPVISWWIDPYVLPGGIFGEGAWPTPYEAYPGLVDVWALSETMRKGLKAHREVNGAIRVFPAPLDYSLFRAAARPWDERDYDICFVGRDHSIKRPWIFERMVHELNLKGVAIVPELNPAWPHDHADWLLDPSRKKIAEIMGRSKIFFLPSREECAPLTIYEALNAGCYPIVNDVGSVREQLRSYGEVYFVPVDHTYYDWNKVKAIINLVLKGSPPATVEEIVAWGEHFDRKVTASRIKQRLQQIEEKL